ncbi:MAG: hypothetical protein ACKO68_01705 [Bacteroidota bacterium]
MNWLKYIQRILAISAIFIIWVVVFRSTMIVEKIHKPETILIPNGTLGLIQVNTPELSKSLLMEFVMNNKDPRILKIVSEYWQNLAQDSSTKQLELDFQQGITLLKVQCKNEIVWMLSGKYCPVEHPLKPEMGFVKNNRYYWMLNASMANRSFLKKHLINKPWIEFNSGNNSPIQYHLLSEGTLSNSYFFQINNDQLTVNYKPQMKIASVNSEKKPTYFHITTPLNRGSFIPEKYQSYKKLIESLSGLSINYYGAKYIDDDSGPSYIEPQFDMLLTFTKKTNPNEILPILKELIGDELRYADQRLYLHNSKYFYTSYNDSVVYIGKNKMKINKEGNTFAIIGNPEVLTNISNLGWKAGVLELIPEYRALNEFSHSIEAITTSSLGKNQQLSIQFKEGGNAQLESFLLVLTLVNAYQF